MMTDTTTIKIVAFLDRIASCVEQLAKTAPDKRDAANARKIAIETADFYGEVTQAYHDAARRGDAA